MLFGADMLASWLFGLVADASRDRAAAWLLGSDQERALRQAVAAAVERVAREVQPADDEQSMQIAMAVGQVLGDLGPGAYLAEHATLLEAVRSEIARQLAPLGDAGLTGTGRSAAELLGVPADELARRLFNSLMREIDVRGAAGGPLAPLARQLNDDVTHEMLGQLPARVVHALAGESAKIPRPAQLPRTIGDFTGRADDLRHLRLVLRERAPGLPGAIVISAVNGQGGVGKSALAVFVANEYRAEFPDGQLYVDLRGMGPAAEQLSADDVLADFLRALGVDNGSIPSSLDRRAAAFRSRLDDKRVLILLDNAADESQIEPLMPASQGCAVLVTSRSRLAALPGARHLHLGVMDKQDAMELFAQLVPRQIIDADPSAAAAIIDLCGRLPLAIRIAGARVAESGDLIGYRRDLTRESTRLAALKHGALDIRASLGLSYHHGLSPRAQRAFRSLGIIGAPTFPSWVVAALLDEAPERAERIIHELVRAQLLENTGRDATGCLRLRFHDLVRDVAREYLDDFEIVEGTGRLAEAYTALAGNAHALLEPPGPGEIKVDHATFPGYLGDIVAAMDHDWLAWFSDDRHNLLDVVKTMRDQELWGATSKLCELLATLAEVPSYWDDWSQVSAIALQANRSGGLRTAEARTLRHLGDLRVYQGRRDDAKVHLQESLDIFRELGDKAGEAATLIRLGEVQRLTGNSAEALLGMGNARAIYDRLGDELGVAYALTSIGGVLRVRARWDESIEAFLECIPLLKAAGRSRQAAIALVSLGDVYHLKSMWAEAYQCFDECLALFGRLGDQMWVQNTRRHIGLVHLILGQPDHAMDCFSEALVTFERLGDRRKEALTRWAIAEAHAARGQLTESIESNQAALRVFEEIGDRFCQAHVLRDIAASRIKLHDAQAQQSVDESLAAALAVDDDLIWAKAQIGLAELLRDQNRLEQAVAVTRESLATFRRTGDLRWQAKALTHLGAMCLDRGGQAEARAPLTEASTIYQNISVPVPIELTVLLSAAN
jgi:tetratricopeptide (TPR) repeat protein